MEIPGGAFPGNSHESKRIKAEQPAPEKSTGDAAPETPQDKKVITGKVTHKQKPLGERFKTMFFDQSFVGHMTEKVIVPKVKDLAVGVLDQILDAVKDGIQEAITGEARPRGTRTSSGYVVRPPRTNYSAISSPSARRTEVRPVIRRANVIQDIFLESREDAERVKEELEAVVDGMGHCTVGDLYSMVGIEIDSTHQSWGWVDLSAMRVRYIPSTSDYKLVMPAPVPIEN